MAEFDLIDLIRAQTATPRADVRLGIGDDAAIVAPPPGQELALCTDTLVAGVHFPPATSAQDIGWKALAVNLSDLAAMGATPAWALLALSLPAADNDFAVAFADGFAALAREYGVALIGGDTTRGALSATVSVLGFVPPQRALRRAGARAGDLVYVTGTLGDAAAGLRCLDPRDPAAATLSGLSTETRAALIGRLNRPQPRVAAGLALRACASAAIDVSDGLVADLGHVATASGVAIAIEAALLPASSALISAFDAAAQRELQLAGGDDYELAFCVSPAAEADMRRDLARVGCGITRIGRVLVGQGVQVLDAAGRAISLTRPGWEHFA